MLAACGQARPVELVEPPANVAMVEPAGAASLYTWPEPRGSEPLPPAFARAGAQFHDAALAFDAGRYLDAAKGFFGAADAVPRGTSEFYATGFTAAREAAYRNAAIAFESADRRDLARAAFARALESDPACAGILHTILRRFDR